MNSIPQPNTVNALVQELLNRLSHINGYDSGNHDVIGMGGTASDGTVVLELQHTMTFAGGTEEEVGDVLTQFAADFRELVPDADAAEVALDDRYVRKESDDGGDRGDDEGEVSGHSNGSSQGRTRESNDVEGDASP